MYMHIMTIIITTMMNYYTYLCFSLDCVTLKSYYYDNNLNLIELHFLTTRPLRFLTRTKAQLINIQVQKRDETTQIILLFHSILGHSF